ncbi:MAG: Swt1 family HEPN domain-containing protein [Planctomycetaceae bacterium]|nr:Swt1 family HEPN domain-containing protein [Planctomycetaceae bacterium]
MLTPHETVGVALDQLTKGLFPFFERELQAAYGADWRGAVRGSSRNDRSNPLPDELLWDSQAILTVMWDHWNAVFRQRMGLFERSLVSELREYRNLWAHQAALTEDDAYRVVDTVQRLLSAGESPDEPLDDLERIKFDLLRRKLGRQINEDLLRARSNRERWTEVGLYSVGCAAILLTTVLVMIPKNPLAGLILCTFSVLVYAYIIVQRWRTPVTIHAVHECPKCRKIIYNEVCPYCETPPSSTIIRGASSLRLPSVREAPTSRT